MNIVIGAQRLAALRAVGITVTAEGEQLHLDGRESALTDDLIALARESKADLLEALAHELERAQANLAEIARQLALFMARAKEADEAGNHVRAVMLHAWAGDLVRIDWLRLMRRQARALNAVGRLPDEDRFLIDEIEEEIEVNGWRPTADGWVEADDRRWRCVWCSEPLAPGHPLACAGHAVWLEGQPSGGGSESTAVVRSRLRCCRS